KTAGKAWFDMAAPMMTPELKRELNMLKLRVALDPKRHYKKQDAKAPPPKYFQMGTIIEGPTEFYSARMTRRERKETLVEQLLADETKQAYFKRKFSEIQEKRQSGGKASYRKKKIIRSGKNRR
ncbi:Fcf2 pre-rRNA processing-domain-containing protein, partial [Piptocephalis cylindrospora]